MSGTLVSTTNKANRHNLPEIMLKVALNTITLKLNQYILKIYEIEIYNLSLQAVEIVKLKNFEHLARNFKI